MNPRTPWRTAADDLLADGDWHPREDLLAVMTPTVPPGKALRSNETDRRRPGRPAERTRGDVDQAIASGARRICSDVLNSAVRSGAYERQGDQYRRSTDG